MMALNRYVNSRSIVFSFALLAGFSASHAQSKLTPAEIYDRCYLRMVRAVPAANDPIMAKVKAGTITAAAGCLELFDKAKFGTNGRIANVNDATSRAIVRTFNDFHGSWFQSRAYLGAAQQAGTTALLIDMEEPALHVTRALFGGARYDSILKGSTPLMGVRSRGARSNLSPYQAQRLVKYPNDLPAFANATELFLGYLPLGATTSSAITIPDSNIVETGELVGVKNALPTVSPRVLASTTGLTAPEVSLMRDNQVLNRNFGGGIIGSQAYLGANANLQINIPAEGDSSINRVVAARAFEDLLCHQLPMLTIADVVAEQAELVRPQAEQMFRRDKSCMQCHAQIDYFAYGYRNLVLSLTDTTMNSTTRNKVGLSAVTFLSYPLNAESKLYRQSAPTGTLRYRGYRATAVTRKNFKNLDELGAGLAESRDLYECAAKRYYKFFTGVDVPLSALPAVPANASSAIKERAKIDMEHQKAVIALAANLKSGQSLRSLVSGIVSSAAFQTRNFKASKEIAP